MSIAWFSRPFLLAAALLTAACLSEDPQPGADAAPIDGPDGGADPSPDADMEDTGSPPDDGGGAEAPGLDGSAPPDGGGMDDAAGPDPDAGGQPDITPMGPLLAHWPLDEGMGTATADVSPNGNGGTLMGATWTTDGFPGAMFPNPAAVAFDGIDDFVELGVLTVPRPEVPKTLSLWFWLEAPAGPGRRNLLALTNLEQGAGIQLGLDGGRASAWLMGELEPLLISPGEVAAGWHHLAYTFDGTTHQLFLDNQSVGTVARAPKAAEVVKARLGTFDLLMEMFAGRIDDVRIYDRALDAAAIGALAGGQVPTP